MSTNSAWSGARPHIDESELLCKTGCGFYGNPAWDGHCSKCYKELVHKRQQRKTVFDPTQIKNKVSRSVSDVSEFQSKASSMMSKKFDKFEEKRKQQLDKKTKAVKSIFRKSHNKSAQDQVKEQPRLPRQLSGESQAVIADFQSFFKNINKDAQQCISKYIKNFMDKTVHLIEVSTVDELGEQVHDFYNNLGDIVATHPAFKDFSQEQADKVNELTERYITTRLYRAFIMAVNAYCEEKDLEIQTRIKSLMWVSISHLECKVDETKTDVRGTMDQIITDLIAIDSRRVPMDKLNLLVSASNQVLTLLKQSSGGIPASADDFLPALIYCVLRANPPLLHSNISYITNFAQQSCLQSGEAGYFFTNLCCAVSFIEKLTGDSLGLTKSEFDRYMSGDALPPNALDGSYMCEISDVTRDFYGNCLVMCAAERNSSFGYLRHTSEVQLQEDSIVYSICFCSNVNAGCPKKCSSVQDNLKGMKLMQQNVDNLTNLETHVHKLINSYDKIIDDMDGFKETLFAEVDKVLEKTPLIIRPKKANIDEHDPTQELLPPPLLPQSLQTDDPNMEKFNESRSVTPLDQGLITPVSGNDTSDILQTMRSYGATQFSGLSTPSGNSFCVNNPNSSQSGVDWKFEDGSFSQFDLDSILASNDPFMMSDSSALGFQDSFSSLDYGLTGTSKYLETFKEENEKFSNQLSTSGTLPSYGHSSHSFFNTFSGSHSKGSSQPQYTGFTIQGGRIPNIPCDTGVSHSILQRSPSPEPLYPHDPLSPPIIGMQGPLPTPLVPTASGSNLETPQTKSEDKIDKMVNLLGDIVNTFDNLL